MIAERPDNSAQDSEQIGRQYGRSVWTDSSRDKARWPGSDTRYGAAGRGARRDILHACVDCLSRATLDACEERRDQAERRKFKLFHKSLRPLNITKVSSLQASTETPSKLFL